MKNKKGKNILSSRKWEGGKHAEGLFNNTIEEGEVREDIIGELSRWYFVIFLCQGFHCIANFTP